MRKILIIGDIHGCYDEMQALLDKAGLGEGDFIIALGDIVDRGPETPLIVEFFQKTPNSRAIMGNHERKHVRAARHEVKLASSQRISRIQLGQVYPDAIEWMEKLPLYIELEDAILVHGYLEPRIPLEQQNPSVLCGTMGGEKMLREHYDRPWYELYDGNKTVIVGHFNYTGSDQPFVYRDKVLGLDTDCVTGKALTGILLPAYQFLTVHSRGNLWGQVRRTYQAAKPQPSMRRDSGMVTWSGEQNQQLEILFQKLQQVKGWLMARVQNKPGYADLTSRQQSKVYAEGINQGVVYNLLQLLRQDKLGLELLRKIVNDPQRLDLIILQVAEIINDKAMLQ